MPGSAKVHQAFSLKNDKTGETLPHDTYSIGCIGNIAW